MADKHIKRNKTDILVSIVVPVYNVEKYVGECIDSLINQTHTNIEIIVIDDGSTDRSGEICERYALEDGRITVIHKENGGLSSARNRGIELMQGDYCCFVDSDDVVADSYIECLLDTAEDEGADIATCSYTRNIKDLGDRFPKQIINVDAHKALEFIFSEKTMTTSAWGKLYKASFWEDVRFPEGYIYEDYATIYKIILKAKKITIIPWKLVFYRPNPRSITGTEFYPKRMQYFEITDELRPAIEKVFPDLLYFVDNRTVRYAIAYYRQIAVSGYNDPEIIKYLRGQVKRGMVQYLRSDYSPLSKAYGILIILSPVAAMHLFSNKYKKGKTYRRNG